MSHPINLSLYLVAGILLTALMLSALPKIKERAEDYARWNSLVNTSSFISMIEDSCAKNKSVESTLYLPPLAIESNGTHLILYSNGTVHSIPCTFSTQTYNLTRVRKYHVIFNNTTMSINITVVEDE